MRADYPVRVARALKAAGPKNIGKWWNLAVREALRAEGLRIGSEADTPAWEGEGPQPAPEAVQGGYAWPAGYLIVEVEPNRG